jgi:hypothetical protein
MMNAIKEKQIKKLTHFNFENDIELCKYAYKQCDIWIRASECYNKVSDVISANGDNAVVQTLFNVFDTNFNYYIVAKVLSLNSIFFCQYKHGI